MITDIAIVGAGLSGLALAQELQRQGADYLLLEARARVGGRILSSVIDGAAFDLGPTWFWPGQPRIAHLAGRLGLGLFEQFAAGETVGEDPAGRVRRGAAIASMAGSVRIDGGMARLTAGLAADLPPGRLRCGVPVHSLRCSAAGVDIDFPGGAPAESVRAARVVLAIPPRLAAATLNFSPALPADAQSALAAVPTWMAGQAKAVALYHRPVWRDSGLSGDALSQRGPLAEIHDASPAVGGPYALFGFIGTPPQIRRQHPEELRRAIREQLGRTFGRALGEPSHLLLQDWAAEALTATDADRTTGGDHPHYGRPAALANLWEGRLLLAGTEMAATSGGYLEGALESAAEVAATLANGWSYCRQTTNLAE